MGNNNCLLIANTRNDFMNKIKFPAGSSSLFFNSLNEDVEEMFAKTSLLKKRKRLLWLKMAFYFAVHISSYIILFLVHPQEITGLVMNYIFIGISGMLLAFNVSHDACHGTFSKNKMVNYWLYHLSFNMQGTNAYLWKIRHTTSHHLFPNVDGCDADIDNNPIIRLSPQHPIRRYQKYQHIYAILVYCIYTLHWFLIKDILYFFKKKIANLQNKKHPIRESGLFIFWKLVYLFVLIYLPVQSGYPFHIIISCFIVMHVINSLFFIHTLIATHLCMETQFPKTDHDGLLPYDYYVHQLATSLDYCPTNKIYNWFLGGFNSHAAHHLYPKLPHTVYPEISMIIKQKAKEFNVQYNQLSLFNSIKSHYRYLKMMGSNNINIATLARTA